MSLKDGDPSAATDHHHKVARVSPSLLQLSINFLQGLCSGSSNRSSSQSRNGFSFTSPAVHQFVLRTLLQYQLPIIITKLKQFLLPFSTCASIYLKDSHLFAATDHHLKVETVSHQVFDLSINFLKGLTSISGNISSSESRNSVSFGSGSIPPFP